MHILIDIVVFDYIHFPGRSTFLFTSLGRVKVPHDYSHKTNKCQYISQHQEIERRLQVSATDSIVRVIGSMNIKF